MGDGLEMEEAGAEETILKASGDVTETRSAVLLVGMGKGQRTCDSLLIMSFFCA